MKSDLRHFFRYFFETSFNVVQSTNCSFSKKLRSFDLTYRNLFYFAEYPNVNASRCIFTQYVAFPPSGKVLKYWTNIVRVYIDSVVKCRKFISHSGRSFNWKSSYISWLKNSFHFRSLKLPNALYLRFHCASAPRRSTRVTFLWSEKRRLTMMIVCLILQRELTKLPRISVGCKNCHMILSRLSGSKMVKRSKFHTQILKFFSVCHGYVCVA